jgi:branched-chain amino acid transport system ATP-binding protein
VAEPHLVARGITVRFGGLVAVDDVSVSADRGEIVGIIGHNGAGKTTLFGAIAGTHRPDAGRVELGGRDVTRWPSHRRARAGLGRTFQRLEVFGSMSAFDNIRTAAEISARASHRSRRTAPELASAIVDRLGLGPVARRRADALPTGQARLVELGRVLAADPKVVLLDEPASGLDDVETERLAEVLTELERDGMAVLLVEHDMDLVMQLCARIYVLNLGEVIASGSPDDVRSNSQVQEAYLGSPV